MSEKTQNIVGLGHFRDCLAGNRL